MAIEQRRTRRRGEKPVDRVPELTHYQDEGCVVWRACLSCPLPVCIYDDPRGARGAGNRRRDAEIAKLYHTGWSIDALTDRFQISRRHVFRILRRERQG